MTEMNVAYFATGITVLGPGMRSLLWLQGCHFAFEKNHCPGCISPHTWDPKQGKKIGIENLSLFLYNEGNLDGITISGGEPFDQADELYELINELNNLANSHKKNLNYIIYTGYKLGELQTEERYMRLLELLDVVIDGKYDYRKDNGIGLRGSTNQTVSHLKPTFISLHHDGKSYFENIPRRMQLITLDNKSYQIGIPVISKLS